MQPRHCTSKPKESFNLVMSETYMRCYRKDHLSLLSVVPMRLYERICANMSSHNNKSTVTLHTSQRIRWRATLADNVVAKGVRTSFHSMLAPTGHVVSSSALAARPESVKILKPAYSSSAIWRDATRARRARIEFVEDMQVTVRRIVASQLTSQGIDRGIRAVTPVYS